MNVSQEELVRIGELAISGWGFMYFKYCDMPGGRHSVMAYNPKEGGWRCHKINATIEDGWVDKLIDEAMES